MMTTMTTLHDDGEESNAVAIVIIILNTLRHKLYYTEAVVMVKTGAAEDHIPKYN